MNSRLATIMRSMRRLSWKRAFGRECCRFSSIPPITTHYSQTKAKAEVEFQLPKTRKYTQRAMSPFVLSSGCVVGEQEITTIRRGTSRLPVTRELRDIYR